MLTIIFDEHLKSLMVLPERYLRVNHAYPVDTHIPNG
jgi:hypothetical protein